MGSLLAALGLGLGWAGEPTARAPNTGELHGDLKSFFLVEAPRPWFGFSDDAAEALDATGLSADPVAQGVASARLKGTVTLGKVRLDAHWAIAAQTVGVASTLPGLSTGVGLRAPELLPLTWAPDAGSGLTWVHRIDRLVLSTKLSHLDLAVGRQPVSFGVGRVFTPLDLVNPFHPATIDTEYKPGVDALRADLYAGTAGHVTLVGAWAGDPIIGANTRDPDQPVIDDLVLAAAGQATVGVTDLLGFLGSVHGEPVLGLGTVSALGPVGIHAEATLTLPQDGADPFVRAVAGADGRPTSTTTLAGEVYVQSFGATDPAEYLDATSSARFARGEIWQMGRWYGALSVSQEITPLLHANLSVIANLTDPSALVAAGGSWSVADNADVVFGGYFGLGEAPEEVDLSVTAGSVALPDAATVAGSVRSEFGLYPRMGYVQVRTYF